MMNRKGMGTRCFDVSDEMITHVVVGDEPLDPRFARPSMSFCVHQTLKSFFGRWRDQLPPKLRSGITVVSRHWLKSSLEAKALARAADFPVVEARPARPARRADSKGPTSTRRGDDAAAHDAPTAEPLARDETGAERRHASGIFSNQFFVLNTNDDEAATLLPQVQALGGQMRAVRY